MKYSFDIDENCLVLDFLSDKLCGVSKNSLKELLKQREIKVDGKRIDQDIFLKKGSSVEIFVPQSFIAERAKAVHEDENILIVDKPPHSSVTGGLREELKEKYSYIAPVHRLDVNTRGLVVFAKNKKAEDILLEAFKNRCVQKKYIALVKGLPNEGMHKAYLFKDEKKGICYVSDSAKSGYKEIITGCKIKKIYGDVSSTQNNSAKPKDKVVNCISEIELVLVTGRTHQLRAHLSHLGCPIVGDDKYGDHAINKRAGTNVQQLVAASMKFDALPPPLDYLNGNEISIEYSFQSKIINRLI